MTAQSPAIANTSNTKMAVEGNTPQITAIQPSPNMQWYSMWHGFNSTDRLIYDQYAKCAHGRVCDHGIFSVYYSIEVANCGG